MTKKTIIFLLVCWLLPLEIMACKQNRIVITEVEANYRDVRRILLDVVRGRGLHISATLHMGNMLRRTARDFGVKQNAVYEAETIEFCSSRIAHIISGANPHNIVFCPFRIVVYTIRDRPGRVFLSYLKLSDAPEEVEKLYQEIVEDISAWW